MSCFITIIRSRFNFIHKGMRKKGVEAYELFRFKSNR